MAVNGSNKPILVEHFTGQRGYLATERDGVMGLSPGDRVVRRNAPDKEVPWNEEGYSRARQDFTDLRGGQKKLAEWGGELLDWRKQPQSIRSKKAPVDLANVLGVADSIRELINQGGADEALLSPVWSSAAHTLLGGLLAQSAGISPDLGRLTESFTHVRKATEVDPERLGAWNAYGTALLAIHQQSWLSRAAAQVKFGVSLNNELGNVVRVLSKSGMSRQRPLIGMILQAAHKRGELDELGQVPTLDALAEDLLSDWEVDPEGFQQAVQARVDVTPKGAEIADAVLKRANIPWRPEVGMSLMSPK